MAPFCDRNDARERCAMRMRERECRTEYVEYPGSDEMLQRWLTLPTKPVKERGERRRTGLGKSGKEWEGEAHDIWVVARGRNKLRRGLAARSGAGNPTGHGKRLSTREWRPTTERNGCSGHSVPASFPSDKDVCHTPGHRPSDLAVHLIISGKRLPVGLSPWKSHLLSGWTVLWFDTTRTATENLTDWHSGL